MPSASKRCSAKIDAMISSNATLNEYSSQIRIDVTPDGLQIQIVDEQNRPMFDSGSAMVKPYMRDILREIGAALGGVENRISLAGHTDAAPYGNGRPRLQQLGAVDRPGQCLAPRAGGGRHAQMTNWRAWWGWQPATCCSRTSPRAPQNRRITITVLTHEAEERLLGKQTPDCPTQTANCRNGKAGESPPARQTP